MTTTGTISNTTEKIDVRGRGGAVKIKYETNTMLITNKNIDVHKNKFVLRRPCVQIDLDSVHITSRKKIRKLLQRDLG